MFLPAFDLVDLTPDELLAEEAAIQAELYADLDAMYATEQARDEETANYADSNELLPW